MHYKPVGIAAIYELQIELRFKCATKSELQKISATKMMIALQQRFIELRATSYNAQELQRYMSCRTIYALKCATN